MFKGLNNKSVQKYLSVILVLFLLLSSCMTAFGDTRNAEKDSQIVDVSRFELEILDGYTRKEDEKYVWEANTSAEGHTYIFNVLFETSGNGMIGEGQIHITLPASILKDKDGNFSDLFEMSVPHIDDIPEEMKDLHNWAYYIDEDGNLVITNVREIPAGEAYQFNIGYTTTKKTFDYEDMEGFDIEAVLDFDVPGSEESRYSDKLTVAIDTNVTITSTNKKKPAELLETWNNLWGPKPEDADDYYYLIWEVESLIDEKSTQYYDFSLEDYDFRISSPANLGPENLKVIGYNYAGSGNAYTLQPNLAENQSLFGMRHDFVLTAVKKELYDQLGDSDAVELENSVQATVDPVDKVDKPTDASASQSFTLKKRQFEAPIGSYTMDKKGDRRFYQLDQFVDPDNSDPITPFPYYINVSGYSYAQTYDPEWPTGNEQSSTVAEWEKYGRKELHYELEDNQVSLNGLIGNKLKSPEYSLQKGDYYFTSLEFSYDIDMVSKTDRFDTDKKQFNLVKPDSNSGYNVSFDVYGEYENEYKKLATIKAYRAGDDAVHFEEGMESYASISISQNSFVITFNQKEHRCSGFRIVTSDDTYYRVNFSAVPRILLNKESESLQSWINEHWGKEDAEKNDDRVTELQVTNTADLKVVEEKTGEILFEKEASGTDYQNGSAKQSSITKSVVAGKNNPLYQRYEVYWKIDIEEYVVVSNTGASRVPVIQYGGDFLDLLPRGSTIDMSTIQVYREGNDPVEFSATTYPGKNNRVLLRVSVAEDQPGEKYSLCFTSYHSWEDIAAFGSGILNPAAYISGNDEMSDVEEGSGFERGRYSGDSLDLMIESINALDDVDDIEITEEDGRTQYSGKTFNRTIFNYEPFDIKAIVMANVGVTKGVKNSLEGAYTTKTVIDGENGEYSYRLRNMNGSSTRSINNVFVDFLELFTGQVGSSAWKGDLQSIDVSNLSAKGIKPRVYYSTSQYELNESRVWYIDPATGNKIRLVEGSQPLDENQETEKEEGEQPDVQDSIPEESDKEDPVPGQEQPAAEETKYIREFLPKSTFETADSNVWWHLVPEDHASNDIYDMRNLVGEDERITAIAVDYTYVNDPAEFQGNLETSGSDDSDEDVEGGLKEKNKDAKMTDDFKYIMSENEAAFIILNFSNKDVSKPEDKNDSLSEEEYREWLNNFNAYNDVYLASSMFNSNFSSKSASDSWLEQNFTTVHYRIRSNFYAKKVNADNEDETIPGITFRLYGTSWYGTKVDESVTTIRNGLLRFENLEAGVYTLVETDCGRDWQIDRTEYKITVHTDKSVTVEPDLSTGIDYRNSNTPFVLKNKPRIHADITFNKSLYEDGKIIDLGVEGAVFLLRGISEYGNEIVKTATSDSQGKVLFEDVEYGTYTLEEIQAPEGYVLSGVTYTVKVDLHGNWSITENGPSHLRGTNSTGYSIGNEKLQEFYLQKRSSEPVGENKDVYLLEGAVFQLTGVPDGGHNLVNITVTSGYSGQYGEGVAHFTDLEPGTYSLIEIQPPVYAYNDGQGKQVEQKFYPDEGIYTVIVSDDGITITRPDGTPLQLVKEGEKEIAGFYVFENKPVGGLVVVRKAWKDNLSQEERIEKVSSPDIVISKETPDPFEVEYAELDYSYTDSQGKQGNFGKEINRVKAATEVSEQMKIFKRYTQKLSYSSVNTISANNKTYPKLLIDSKDDPNDERVSVISTADSPKPIYGWLDPETNTYYWYTEATGAWSKTARDMFSGVATLEEVDFSGIDFSRTETFAYMFNQCTNLQKVENLTRPADAVPASTKDMFLSCTRLGENGTLNFSRFNTSGINNMHEMFKSAIKSGNGTKINWGTALNTESVTKIAYMFNSCTALTEIRAAEMDLSNVSEPDGFEWLFGDSENLSYIPVLIRNNNAGGNMTMFKMFKACKKLTSLDLSKFYTKGINSMASAFESCSGLTRLDLSHFDTSQVTSMKLMFNGCTALKSVNLENFNTSNVTEMDQMFDTCKQLTVLDISSFTKNKEFKTANTMFCNCEQLVTIYAREEFDLSDIAKDSNNVFLNDGKLSGGLGTAYANNPQDKNSGKYARVDGLNGQMGYFTKKSPVLQAKSLQVISGLSEALFFQNVKKMFAVYAYDAADQGNQETISPILNTQKDSPYYRSSANHRNSNNNHDFCEENHFYVAKNASELHELLEKFPELAGALSNVADNEWIYVFDDVLGEDFSVWEENIPAGYEGDFDNYVDENGVHRVTRIENGAAVVTNYSTDYVAGSLSLSKRVLDSETEQDVSERVNDKFLFEITLSNMPENGTKSFSALYYQTAHKESTALARQIVFTNRKSTVEIQSGYTLEFEDLPLETTYTIVEKENGKVLGTDIKIDGEESPTPGLAINGEISEEKKDVFVEYQNTLKTDLRNTGEFMLKKLLDESGEELDADTEFQFIIEFTNLAASKEYSIYNGQSVKQSFTSAEDGSAAVVIKLKKNETLRFKDIPENAKYRITESASGLCISSYEISNGQKGSNTAPDQELTTDWQTMDPTKDPLETTFTNKIIKVQSLSVSKRVVKPEGSPIDPSEKYTFEAYFSRLGSHYPLIAAGLGTFTSTENGTLSISFFLKDGEEVTFINLPPGAEYQIYENYDGELIPYYETTRVNEVTGEAITESSDPSAFTGKQVLQAVKNAQDALLAAQNEMDLASAAVHSSKTGLDRIISQILEKLSEKPDENIVANFNSDNFEDNRTSYMEARNELTLEADQVSELEISEQQLEKDLLLLEEADKGLQDAREALNSARASSIAEGSVNLNEDISIRFSNYQPIKISLKKEVEGYNSGSPEFIFHADFSLEGKKLQKVTAIRKPTDPSKPEETVTYVLNGEDFQFGLQGGETIEFINLPYGTAYSITEEAISECNVSFRVSEGSQGLLNEQTISGIGETDIQILCINTFPEPGTSLPETGGIQPIGLTLIGIILLGLGFALLKRSQSSTR